MLVLINFQSVNFMNFAMGFQILWLSFEMIKIKYMVVSLLYLGVSPNSKNLSQTVLWKHLYFLWRIRKDFCWKNNRSTMQLNGTACSVHYSADATWYKSGIEPIKKVNTGSIFHLVSKLRMVNGRMRCMSRWWDSINLNNLNWMIGKSLKLFSNDLWCFFNALSWYFNNFIIIWVIIRKLYCENKIIKVQKCQI